MNKQNLNNLELLNMAKEWSSLINIILIDFLMLFEVKTQDNILLLTTMY